MDPGWRPPTLTTDRLVLRAFVPTDAPSLFIAAGNPNITRYTYWDYHQSIETSQFFINDYVRNKYLQAEAVWSNASIGSAALPHPLQPAAERPPGDGAWPSCSRASNSLATNSRAEPS